MAEKTYRRVKLTIVGDVQGVFFRHFAKEEADKYGLCGWCRNEADGSVFAVVEGEDKAVDHFIKWANKGSMLATVDDVVVSEEKYTGTEREFEIR